VFAPARTVIAGKRAVFADTRPAVFGQLAVEPQFQRKLPRTQEQPFVLLQALGLRVEQALCGCAEWFATT
jgi:hypothetical protein